jgi:macrolide transport system ATP-binding/permease protein
VKPSRRIALELADVHYAYDVEGRPVPALRGISLRVAEGEMVAIQGPSGSGKSTLLYLLGCMLNPDQGKVKILGQDVSRLSDKEKAYFRNRRLGFVFQQFHLLASRDVLNNILLPASYPLEAPGPKEDFVGRARKIAARIGLTERLDHKPHQLSGGQQQRVAIARALIRDAPIILADEPTGNLDSKSSAEILQLLRELNREGKTVVIITHDRDVAEKCDRTIWIRDGRVEGQDPLGDEVEGDIAVEPIPLKRLGLWNLLRESMPQALDNVWRNRTRSALTMMGVVVGVASVLSMLTLGSFTKAKILQSYATLGINTLQFYAYPEWSIKAKDLSGPRFYALNVDRDLVPLTEIFPEIRRVAPSFSDGMYSVIYGGRSIQNEVMVAGGNADTFPITQREIVMGTGIQPFHVQNRSSVCVIGFEIAERLFSQQNPIGEPIQVATDEANFSCVVIGVAKPTFSKERRFKPDLEVTVPYTVFLSLPIGFWQRSLREMVLEVEDGYDVEETGRKLQAFFEKRYGKSGRFRASNNTVLVAQMKRFLTMFTLLLGCIAAVTLVVGGMGITNMMMVSVNERLREIGLRKALGASHQAIRQLFFAESLFLCLSAGLIGLVSGFITYQFLIYAGSRFIENLKYEWVFNPAAFLVAFVAILLTGVLSGLGPALKAEKLQVIEALRAE